MSDIDLKLDRPKPRSLSLFRRFARWAPGGARARRRGLSALVNPIEPAPAPSSGARAEVLRGCTSALPISDLLGFMQARGGCGVLRIALESELVALHIWRGSIVQGRSDNPPPGSRLGEILVRQGALHARVLDSVLAQRTGVEGNLGRALVVQRHVSREQVRDALAEQLRILIERLLPAEDALFLFREGEVPEPADGLRFDVGRLLIEAAKAVDERMKACATSARSPQPEKA